MNKPLISFILLFLISCIVSAQTAYKITYEKFSNDVKVDEENPTVVWANEQESIIGTKNAFSTQKKYPYEIISYQKYDSILYPITFFSNDSVIATKNSIGNGNLTYKKTKRSKRILGIKCKHAEVHINSNKIDLWYVDNLPIQAAPNTVGLPLGLVMEYERNNNFSIRVNKIEEVKNIEIHHFTDFDFEKVFVPMLDYRNLVWKSRFVHIPIFDHQQIHFGAKNQFSPDSTSILANGTVVVKKIKFPTLQEDDQIFLQLTQFSNGDAYDRTGSVFLIPIEKKPNFLEALQNGIEVLPFITDKNKQKYQGMIRIGNYEPLVELMRFFTPFGIREFNHIEIKDHHWLNAAEYRQEISDLKNLLSNKEVYIGIFIGNYDQGGHIVSAEATIHRGGKSVFPTQKSLPLFNTLNVMEMAGQNYGSLFSDEKGLVVRFDLKEDWNNAYLRLITTGHGGWENGDEFLAKENTVYLNDKKVFQLAPWRTDCGSYRMMNPASGNFENGLSSSDYNRSNWCPGTVTPPYYIQLGNLKAGKHQLQIIIPQGEKEGNSFSFWSVSGILLGE